MKRMEFRKRAYTAPACTVIPVPVESLPITKLRPKPSR